MLEQRRADAVAHPRELSPDQLHDSVAGEWCSVETVRHLVFATPSGIGHGVLGDPPPGTPWGMPWDEAPDDPAPVGS